MISQTMSKTRITTNTANTLSMSVVKGSSSAAKGGGSATPLALPPSSEVKKGTPRYVFETGRAPLSGEVSSGGSMPASMTRIRASAEPRESSGPILSVQFQQCTQ